MGSSPPLGIRTVWLSEDDDDDQQQQQTQTKHKTDHKHKHDADDIHSLSCPPSSPGRLRPRRPQPLDAGAHYFSFAVVSAIVGVRRQSGSRVLYGALIDGLGSDPVWLEQEQLREYIGGPEKLRHYKGSCRRDRMEEIFAHASSVDSASELSDDGDDSDELYDFIDPAHLAVSVSRCDLVDLERERAVERWLGDEGERGDQWWRNLDNTQRAIRKRIIGPGYVPSLRSPWFAVAPSPAGVLTLVAAPGHPSKKNKKPRLSIEERVERAAEAIRRQAIRAKARDERRRLAAEKVERKFAKALAKSGRPFASIEARLHANTHNEAAKADKASRLPDVAIAPPAVGSIPHHQPPASVAASSAAPVSASVARNDALIRGQLAEASAFKVTLRHAQQLEDKKGAREAATQRKRIGTVDTHQTQSQAQSQHHHQQPQPQPQQQQQQPAYAYPLVYHISPPSPLLPLYHPQWPPPSLPPPPSSSTSFVFSRSSTAPHASTPTLAHHSQSPNSASLAFSVHAPAPAPATVSVTPYPSSSSFLSQLF